MSSGAFSLWMPQRQVPCVGAYTEVYFFLSPLTSHTVQVLSLSFLMRKSDSRLVT